MSSVRISCFALLCVALSAFTAAARTVDGFNPEVDKAVYALALQPDGRVLAGGLFSSLCGQPRNGFGRINPDGTLDMGFNPNPNSTVYALLVQPDGRIVVGGSFTNIVGQSRNHLARLNVNGSLDTGFNPGADGDVLALALQADGKLVVGGNFNTLGGAARSCIGRLTTNGLVDAAFNPGAGSVVVTLAVQPDGKILAGGGFFSLGGQGVSFLGRVNSDGTADTNFVAGANNWVYAFEVQPDNSIIVGGHFTTMNGQPRNRLARLTSSGAIEPTFNPNAGPAGLLSDVYSLASQADGRLFVAGVFFDLGGQACNSLGRLNSDGTLDTNFNAAIGGPDSTTTIYSAALQKDGKLLAGGWGFLPRYDNPTPATETLTASNDSTQTTITWQRQGASPELLATTFEVATNGGPWRVLGAGSRIGSVWQLTVPRIGSSANVRAHGLRGSGYQNGSGSLIESLIGPVIIVTQPASRTNDAGTAATFNVLAGGTPAMNFRWRKNGLFLADTGNVSGSATATLTLSNVLRGDAAAYTVVITNAFGAVTSSVANLTVIEPLILNQPTNQYVDAGATAQFTVGAVGTTLTYQWNKNGAAISGATGSALSLTNVQGAISGSSYRVVVTSPYGAVTSAVATLTVNTALVDSFNPSPNYPVRALAVAPDGKVLLSGYFSFVGAQLLTGVARLNDDGSLDQNFTAGLLGIPFSTALPLVAIQEDQKILLAGGISSINGRGRSQIGRLNPDSTLDLAFNPGADAEVFAMALQSDGKLVLGGNFTNLAGHACNRIGRLNTDGTLDNDFAPGANGTVYSLALQTNGMLVVGGSFTSLAGQARTNIGRLTSNGSLDTSFNPGADGTVNALAIQTNGFILVGGAFTGLAGQPRNFLGRLGPAGSIDISFNPNPDGPVSAFALQTDGKVVVGGGFYSVGGQLRSGLARLNVDGSVDMTFNPAPNGSVTALALEPDGRLLVAGNFTTLDGQPRNYVGRLNNPIPATRTLVFDGSSITWLRAGVGPEFSRVVFDTATNGASLVPFPASRIAGGWQLTGLNLPTNATVRARGFVAGSTDGSSWFVESVLGPPLIESQPASLTNNPFTQAAFTVLATGAPTLSYQWLKNGFPLHDGGNVFGTQTPTLTLTNVLGGDAGQYSVAISNFSGSVTSQVASLTVLDPLLTGQPSSQSVNANQAASFSVSAVGTTPLSYQWLKDGVPLSDGGNISGAQTVTLSLSSTLGGDVGAYQAVVANAWGSVTSQVANLTVTDPLLVTNPLSQFAQRGQTVTFSVGVVGTTPLAFQWRKDTTALAGATASSLVVANVQWSDVGAYDVVVSNTFGSVTSLVANLTVNLATTDAFNPSANNSIYALAVQADGKVLVGGAFTAIGGQGRQHLARLNVDGSLDTAFNPGASNIVYTLAVQTDGKILVGGSITSLAGQPCSFLGRLNPDGTLDQAFAPNPNWYVTAIAVQPDNSIVIGGGFGSISGVPRLRLGRLFSDGSLDQAFSPSVDNLVQCLALQPDGALLVGGIFGSLAGQPCANLGRLNPDGSRDSSFNPGPDNSVDSLALQADGKILVGGGFANLGGQPHANLGRLNTNGSLDSAFTATTSYPGYGSAPVYSIAVQADGRVVVAGSFLNLAGQPRNNIGRVNADGSLDPGFNSGADYAVYSLALQEDGNLLAAGFFGTLGGQTRSRIGRLNRTDPAVEVLSSDASTLSWLRAGTGPEVVRTTFETSTTGTNWSLLGVGERIAGGWRLTGLSLPPNATLRARGFITGSGYFGNSSWFVESMAGSPLFVKQPASRTNSPFTTATFNASAIGGEPIVYQWLKNGTPISDGGNVSGSTSTTLTLSNVLGGDVGAYALLASNAAGSVTSLVASLTVPDPVLTAQPVNVATNVGQTAVFRVTAVGTTPLSYQWRKEGMALASGTLSSLTLTNSQQTDAGTYDVIVSNAFGSVTSLVATLTLNLAVPDSFNPGANGPIYVMLPQPDGKVLIGGSFSTLAGSPRFGLGRLNADGTLDTTLNLTNSAVYALALQSDGKLLGAGISREQLPGVFWRLNANGTLDTNFIASASAEINSIALQADGKIIVGGAFSTLDKVPHPYLGRLNGDGSLDTNFTVVPNGVVFSLALQPDGKLLVGGGFTTLGGIARTNLARLNADGTVDTNFVANSNPGLAAASAVDCIALQPDGKIVIGGSFSTLDGQPRSRIGRLFEDGTLDTGFNPNANGTVYSLLLQADGRILVGGSFTTLGGQTRNRIARLNADGSLDTLFNPGANGANNIIYSLALQTNGALLAGGAFSTMAGVFRTNLARIVNPDPATQNLSAGGASLTWLRGGSSPEFSRTSFEASTDGTNWSLLGAGSRISGGWRLSGIALPPGATVRARGHFSGSRYNGSSGFFEIRITPPTLFNARSDSGHFGFNIGSAPGQVVVIEASTDFAIWVPVQTNLTTSLGVILFDDAESGLFPHRFYRARLSQDPLPAPVIAGPASFQSGIFGFNLSGTAGQSVVVETSTNLLSWLPLTTNLLSPSPLFWTDPSATNLPSRFYRLRVQ